MVVVNDDHERALLVSELGVFGNGPSNCLGVRPVAKHLEEDIAHVGWQHWLGRLKRTARQLTRLNGAPPRALDHRGEVGIEAKLRGHRHRWYPEPRSVRIWEATTSGRVDGVSGRALGRAICRH